MQLSQQSQRLAPGLLAAAAALYPACSSLQSPPTRPPPAAVQLAQPRIEEVSIPDSPARFSDNLDAYIRSIGAGWGPAQRPTGFVAVRVQGETQFAKGYGLANAEDSTAHSLNTSYRIGGITKGFTAAAVLRLGAAERLSTTDSIGKHLANYPPVGSKITLHQLLRHTAGLPEYTARRNRPMSPTELLKLFWEEPLDFQPGSAFSYTNSGYVVLGAVVESVTESTYGKHLETKLLQPLGLADTVVGDALEDPQRAVGYTRGPEDTLQLAPAISMSVPFSAGGMRSTPADLLRWHEALSSDSFLPEDLRTRLLEPGKGNYAYGFVVEQRDGHQVYSQSGAIDGFMSAFVRVPELDIAVVVLLNADTVPAEPIAEAALQLALGHEVLPLKAEPPLPLTPEMIVLTEGRYVLTEESLEVLRNRGLPAQRVKAVAHARIFKSGDTLKFKPGGQPAVRLVAVSEDRLRLLGASAELRVVRQGKSGRPSLRGETPPQADSPERPGSLARVGAETSRENAEAPEAGIEAAGPSVDNGELSEREASWAPTAVGGKLLPVAEILELSKGPLRLRFERVQPPAAQPLQEGRVELSEEDRRARFQARRAERLKARAERLKARAERKARRQREREEKRRSSEARPEPQ